MSRILYAGTFGVVSTFYFATSSMLVRIAIALYLGRLSIGPEKYREMMEGRGWTTRTTAALPVREPAGRPGPPGRLSRFTPEIERRIWRPHARSG